MAHLTPDVMFSSDNTKGCSDIKLAILNFELQEALGDLKPGTPAYLERAKAFHDEVARR